MATAGAFIRIKRKLHEDAGLPENFILCAKRQKKDETSQINAVMRFVGTQQSKCDELSKEVIDKALKKGLPIHKNPKAHTSNLHAKQRKEHEIISKTNRLKLVNSFRNVDDAEQHDLSFALYEIEETPVVTEKQVSENTITCNGIPLVKTNTNEAGTSKSDTDDVFAIYFVEDLLGCKDMKELENSELSINFDINTENPNEDDDYPEVYDEEDDSNDELNWRNEYPEDSDSSKNSRQDSDSDYDIENYCPRDSPKLDFSKMRFEEDSC